MTRRAWNGAVLAALALAPAAAWAHEGEHGLSAHEVLRWWTWDPLVLALLVVSAVLYAAGLWRLSRRGSGLRGLRAWEVAAFAGGLLSVFIALVSPLDALSDRLFSAHMGQHEILMVVAPPLLVLGRPLLAFLWALPSAGRVAVGRWTQRPAVHRTWRAITGPFVVMVAHAVALWIWHVPALFEAALRSEAVHTVQHASFFLTAALFFWAILHGRYGRMGYGAAVVYVFVTAAHTSVLGVLLTFARTLWYPLYAARAEGLGVDVQEDQQLAGLLMWVPAGTLLALVGLALFAAWLGEAERRVAYTTAEGLRSGGAPRREERAHANP